MVNGRLHPFVMDARRRDVAIDVAGRLARVGAGAIWSEP